MERPRLRAPQGRQILLCTGLPRARAGARDHGQQKEWEKLPPDLQAIIEVAASATANETLADFVYHNVESFVPLLGEGVELRTFPEDIVRAMGREAFAVFEEIAAKDPLARKVHDSFMNFLRKAVVYSDRFDARLLAMRRIVVPL